LRPLRGGGIPAVLVDRTVEGFDADLVGLDNRDAVRLGVQHLLDQGFDCIQFIVQPFEQVSSRRERELAFRETMAARGQPAEPAVVLDLNDPASVERALAEIDARIEAVHQRGGKRLALFVANAPVALVVARHLRTRFGTAWQERAALLSIDDPEWAELIGITTIRQPTYDIGYKAVEFVHERIEGVSGDARVVLLPGTLVERASTVHSVEEAS
jgi:LacI family kdg operon repressor